ncbi:hypothetical protein [Streptomyces sp. CRN 30]|uniref:hypothetical protein n=1 Tax=Streptomyces sp. CRN 30 TaxID=3075613 RepID=UPI002A80CFC2|nr:hypothetical protein [Streptomyces sp. CRN 30]
MTWHWSDPIPLDPDTAYTYELEAHKSTGGDALITLTGNVIPPAGTDPAAAIEELLAPAVANGWVVSVKRIQRQRHEASLLYGG